MPRGGKPGNRGGGRKSAYQEKADAELLAKMFFEKLDKEEVRAMLATGKYSLKDVFLSKGFTGNDRVLLAIFNKLFPDKLIHSGTVAMPNLDKYFVDV